MEKNKGLLQTILLIIILSLTAFLGLNMPLVGIAYPIILTFIGLKNGRNKNIVIFITSLIILGVITMNIDALIIPFQYGILSIATIYLINKKYRPSKIILYSAVLVFSMVLIHMGLTWYFTGINTLTDLENNLTTITKEQIEIIKSEDMSESQKSQMANILKTTVDFISSVIPSLLIISSTIIAYINYYISTRLASKSGKMDIEVPKFSTLSFPRNTITGLGTILLISYILKYIGNFNYIQLIDNLFILIYVVFLLQGLSFVVFLINKMKFGKFLKTLFITLIVLSSFFNIVLFSVGIIDIVFNLRKIRRLS